MSYIEATGKRKTSIARVFMAKGKGNMVFNGKDFETYFPRATNRDSVMTALKLTGKETEFDFKINVRGGGPTGQADAIRHAIARALLISDADLRGALKAAGLLRRDARIVERKKYGRHKARRSCQFSKR
jgi:small subunit ribosomal protein S9